MNDKYLNINSDLELLHNAESSLSLNPAYQWAKIIVCDSEPNGNGFRVPEEEFDNLISTGINAPIKMARNKISNSHMEAFGNPIGVISNLTKEGNKVIALAALWKQERPEDIAKLKDMYNKGNPPNVSWEILYASEEETEDKVKTLRGCILNGLAVVAMPAYKGRTPFIAMSSMDTEAITEMLGEADVWTTAYVDSLPDEAFLYVEDGDKEASERLRYFPYLDDKKQVNLPHLNNALASLKDYDLDESIKEKIEEKAKGLLLEANSNLEENKEKMEKLEELQSALDVKTQEFNDKVAELTELSTKYAELETKATELKEFKEGIEAVNLKKEKLASIKTKFETAGIKKDEAYFAEKEETLLSLDEAGLEFVIQEIVSGLNSNTASLDVKVPNVVGKTGITKDELLSGLKSLHSKNK